jgi:hypothetical protein
LNDRIQLEADEIGLIRHGDDKDLNHAGNHR